MHVQQFNALGRALTIAYIALLLVFELAWFAVNFNVLINMYTSLYMHFPVGPLHISGR